MKNKKRYLYHDQGEGACGHRAFIYNKESGPYLNHTIINSELTRLNGKPMFKHEKLTCGFCCKAILKVNVSSVR